MAGRDQLHRRTDPLHLCHPACPGRRLGSSAGLGRHYRLNRAVVDFHRGRTSHRPTDAGPVAVQEPAFCRRADSRRQPGIFLRDPDHHAAGQVHRHRWPQRPRSGADDDRARRAVADCADACGALGAALHLRRAVGRGISAGGSGPGLAGAGAGQRCNPHGPAADGVDWYRHWPALGLDGWHGGQCRGKGTGWHGDRHFQCGACFS